MDIKGYNYKIDDGYLNYEFYSEGPKGKIKKIVRFSPANAGGRTYFNLSFGDWNEKGNEVDDMTISNNMDRMKVLSTIATIVLEFTMHFPDMRIYAKGSTPSRTRLYQMAIASRFKEIESLFNIYGSVNDEWQVFKPSINYEAFMILRKYL